MLLLELWTLLAEWLTAEDPPTVKSGPAVDPHG
jgi:hypothetical protein